jgi:hypothetical protein
MVGLIIFAIAVGISLTWLWVGGIDYMRKSHPEYKGDDFLNWTVDDEDINQIS